MADIVRLQRISFGQADPLALAELLFEAGYDDPEQVAALIDGALGRSKLS